MWKNVFSDAFSHGFDAFPDVFWENENEFTSFKTEAKVRLLMKKIIVAISFKTPSPGL